MTVKEAIDSYTKKFGGFPYFLFLGAEDEQIIKAVSQALESGKEIEADQGDADAQYNLGVCYEKGRGVTQSYDEAVKWFRKAAEQGYSRAKDSLTRLKIE